MTGWPKVASTHTACCWNYEETKKEGDDVGAHSETSVASNADDETGDKGDEAYGAVPIPRCFFILPHGLIVPVRLLSSVSRYIFEQLLSVEENDPSKEGADLGCEAASTAAPGWTVCLHRHSPT